MVPRIALLATAWMSIAHAAGPEIPAFRAYEQLTYTLITHDEHTARQVPGQIARINGFLTQLMPGEVQAPNAPTVVFIVPAGLWRNYLRGREYSNGEFVPGRFTNYLLIQNEVNSFTVRGALFHEYTHLFMRSQLRRLYPVWLDEGLATLVEYSKFQDTRVQVGSQLQYDGVWIPLERLFQLDRSSPEYRSETQSKSVHFGAWALVHRAFIQEPEFGRQLFEFLGALNNFNPVSKALPQSFGVSAEELDARMRRYARQATGTSVIEIRIPPVPAPTVPPGRDMRAGESFILLADVMLASGFNPGKLAEIVEAAHAAAPDSPEVHALRMRLAVRDRDDAALQRLLVEAEPRLDEVPMARGIGLALFERVREEVPDDTLSVGERERLGRKAFDLLDQAVMGKPDDVEAIWGYATLAARFQQDLPNALKRLDRALGIASHNADLAMATALVYQAQGERLKMIPFLVVTARMTADVAQRAWALNRVNELLAEQAAAAP